jgi:cytochrome P450
MPDEADSNVFDFPFLLLGEFGAISPRFAELRDQGPAHRVRLPSGAEVTMVVSYEDVRAVQLDFSRDLSYEGAPSFAVGDTYQDPDALVNMDPPRHTRLRNIVGPLFTKRRAEEQRAGIERVADRLLERIAAVDPPIDLVEAFAMALPIHVICDVLDLPVQDAPKLRTWSDAFMSVSAASLADLRASAKSLRRYAEALVDERRASPRGGILDALVAASLTDERAVGDDETVMSRDELIRMVVGLIVAGHETTGVVIARGVLTLLRHPDILRALRNEPAGWPSAVEEILRHDVPGHGGLLRVAPEDVVLPSGAQIAAGEVVMAVQSPANHDPIYFEDPDTFDPERAKKPNLTFGYGPHYCLGAHLARVELQVAFPALFGRFPDLSLAVPAESLQWSTSTRMRALRTLPVRWGRS